MIQSYPKKKEGKKKIQSETEDMSEGTRGVQAYTVGQQKKRASIVLSHSASFCRLTGLLPCVCVSPVRVDRSLL